MSPERRIGVSLPELVPYELMIECGFNHFEPTALLPKEAGKGIVYISEPYPTTNGKNIVIIEQTKDEHKQWYFGFFEGKPMHERETEEEAEAYWDEVSKILSDDHKLQAYKIATQLKATLITE